MSELGLEFAFGDGSAGVTLDVGPAEEQSVLVRDFGFGLQCPMTLVWLLISSKGVPMHP